jgi:hypothetical protein
VVLPVVAHYQVVEVAVRLQLAGMAQLQAQMEPAGTVVLVRLLLFLALL